MQFYPKALHEAVPQGRLELRASIGGDSRGNTETRYPRNHKRLSHSLSSNVGDGDRLRPAGEPVNYCQQVGVTFAEGQGAEKVEVHSIKKRDEGGS